MTPEALADLHARAFAGTPPRPWSAAEFAGLMAHAATVMVHAPQGFALGRCLGEDAELLTLAVAPEARRQGRGAALVLAFEAEARAQGAQRVVLEVAESNAGARGLYARLGYAAVGRRPGYFRRRSGTAVDGLVLAKPLDPAHTVGARGKTI
jgi:[ribosomal protein S18]-alanine N-acetyltransferase